jgi:hypothetical protein
MQHQYYMTGRHTREDGVRSLDMIRCSVQRVVDAPDEDVVQQPAVSTTVPSLAVTWNGDIHRLLPEKPHAQAHGIFGAVLGVSPEHLHDLWPHSVVVEQRESKRERARPKDGEKHRARHLHQAPCHLPRPLVCQCALRLCRETPRSLARSCLWCRSARRGIPPICGAPTFSVRETQQELETGRGLGS